MEAWGVDSFENKDAKEWCQAYREMGLPVAKSTLDVALGDLQSASLGADIACRAIAAVEAVAYALGRGSPEAQDLFRGAPDADPADAAALLDRCNEAIEAITGGSGLAAYWENAKSDKHAAWLASLTALQSRLNGGARATRDRSEPEAPKGTSEIPVAAGTAPLEDQLADIRNALAGLEADIEVMRQEMREGLIELAKRVARGDA
ncbi:MAG: DUF4259 domain-containing protein [Pseudomonadota bacterium]